MRILQTLCILSVATLLRSVGRSTRLNPYDDRCRVRFSESKAEDCPSVGYFFDSRSRLCKRTCSDDAPFESTSKCTRRCRSVVVCFIPRRRNYCGDVPMVTVYYFNINKGRCLAERGCTYNGNNFPTLGECERTCGVRSQEAGEAASGAQFGARDNQTWNQPHREPYTNQQAPPVIASLNNATATGSESPSTYTLSPDDLKCHYQEQQTVRKNCSSLKYYFDHASRVCKTTCNTEAPFNTGWECSWICRSVVHCFIQRPAVLCAGRQTTTIYYFDIFKGMCFPQQGCSYRGNNFPTLHECQRTCGVYTATKQQAEVAGHTSYAVPSNTRPPTPQLEAPNTVRELTGARQANNVAEPTGGSESSVRRSTSGTDLTEVSEAGSGHSSALVNAAYGNAAGRQHYNMSTESTPEHGISGPYPAAISNSPLDNGEGVAYSPHTTHSIPGNEVHLRYTGSVAGSTGSSASEAGYTNMKPQSTDGNIPGVRQSPHVRNSARVKEPAEGAISGARSSPTGARGGGGHADRESLHAEVNQTDVRHRTGPVTSSAGNGEEAASSPVVRNSAGGRGTWGRHSSGEPQPTEESGSAVRNHRGTGGSAVRNETEKAHPETVPGSNSQGGGRDSVNSNLLSHNSEGNAARALHHPGATHSMVGRGRYGSLRYTTGGLGSEGGSFNTLPQSSEDSARAGGSHTNLTPSTTGNIPEAGHPLGVGSAGDRRIGSGHASVVPHAPQGSVTGPAVSSVSTGTTTSSLTGTVYPNINRRPKGSGGSAATYPLGLTEAEILKGAATLQEIFAAIQDFIGTLPFNTLRKKNRRPTRRQELTIGTP
ncbi:uncharacterized protein LOC142564859 isoform X2 [Dermacentor variabilis]|uniref:uncharacterized protein LOC142564859 isoform X2 n=1 Tax=Dermacentor variabilis TaxID=34621 RepID=UPI003F5BAA2E